MLPVLNEQAVSCAVKFGLGIGAEMMVSSASEIARHFGISELVIGVTVVALGTSLPELAASMMSAWKGEMDISIGNIIGSNIFNILFVLVDSEDVERIRVMQRFEAEHDVDLAELVELP